VLDEFHADLIAYDRLVDVSFLRGLLPRPAQHAPGAEHHGAIERRPSSRPICVNCLRLTFVFVGFFPPEGCLGRGEAEHVVTGLDAPSCEVAIPYPIRDSLIRFAYLLSH
jgi:hypothetical protein